LKVLVNESVQVTTSEQTIVEEASNVIEAFLRTSTIFLDFLFPDLLSRNYFSPTLPHCKNLAPSKTMFL